MNYFLENYVNFLGDFLKIERPLKVVADCSNGVTGVVLQALINKLKKENSQLNFILINEKPDGNFPAHGPNPLEVGALDQLQQLVIKEKADAGVAFDADGDRAFFVDNFGQSLTSGQAAAIIGQNFNDPFVFDLIIGKLPWEVLKGKIFESRVGSLFVKELMRANQAQFGAEYSGHFYFKDFNYNDSGILAAIFFFNWLSKQASLKDWLASQPQYYSQMVNLTINRELVPKKLVLIEDKLKDRAQSISKLDMLKMEFGGKNKIDNWWFNIRLSNTENLVRINIEARDKELLKTKLREIQALLG